MKNIFLIFIFITIGYSQIIEEREIEENKLFFSYLKYSGVKFYHVYDNSLEILNSDGSYYKSVSIPVELDMEVQNVYLLSEGVFTSSVDLSFAVTYFKNGNILKYHTNIVSESGSVILSMPKVNFVSVTDSEDGPKMVSWIYDDGEYRSKLYSLPGDLVSETEIDQNLVKESIRLENPFPNPSNGNILLNYHLPEGETKGEMKIFNSNGIEVRNFLVDDSFSSIVIETDQLPSGSYHYIIKTKSSVSGKKTFVVVK
ncbi:MAG: hypothetical protein CR982_10085 [Candidatus Cloacimonadota bacterium]|nr:MAG: hypothetical protein CR982_10085 [Candidatus Cloacimonadota bacterium]PIE77351.1 MAG: hypothetical protein CSA15_13425 [Candidatus Delongbacteria bacterium]